MDGQGLGAAEGAIKLDASGALRSLDQVGAGLRNLDAQSGKFGTGFAGAIQRNEQAITGMGRGLLGLGGIMLGTFGLGVKTAMDFDAQMSAVQSVTGATQDELAGLRDEALRLGAATTFSGSEAAAAMEIMAKAGVSLGDIMNGSAEDILNLSAAAGVDVTLAAETASAAMNVFGVSSEEAANIIARSANASSLSVNDWALAMKSAAPVADALGIGMEELAAGMMILSDAGISGEVAATALRNIMLNLSDSTHEGAIALSEMGIATYDAQGQFRGLEAISHDLAGAWAGMNDEQRLMLAQQVAGKDGAAAFMTIMDAQTESVNNNSDAFQDAEGRMNGVGTAQEQAAQRMDNLTGKVEELKGVLETIAITIASHVTPALTAFVEMLTNLARKVLDLPAGVQKAIAVFLGIGGALAVVSGGFLLMLPRIASTITALQSMGGLSGIISKLGTALRGLALNPVFLVAMAAFLAYRTNFLGFRDAVNAAFKGVVKAFDTIADKAGDVLTSFRAMRDKGLDPVEAGLVALRAAFPALGRVITPMLRIVENVKRTWDDLTGVFQRLRSNGINPVSAVLGSLITVFPMLKGVLNPISNAIQEVTEAFSVFRDAGANPVEAALQALMQVFPALTSVIEPVLDVFENLHDAFANLVRGDFPGFFDNLGDAAGAAFDAILAGARLIGSGLLAAFQAIDWGAVGSAVLSGIQMALSWLAGIGGAIWAWISGAVSGIDWASVWDTVQDATGTILGKLGEWDTKIKDWVVAAIDAVPWGALWDGVQDVTGTIVGKLGDLFQALFNWVWEAASAVNWGELIGAAASTAGDITGTIVGKLGNLLQALFTWVWDAASQVQWGELIGAAAATAGDITSTIVSRLGNLFQALFNWVWTSASAVPWGDLLSAAAASAGDITVQIVTGLGNLGDALSTWVSDAVRLIPWDTVGTNFGTFLRSGFRNGVTNMVNMSADLFDKLTESIEGINWEGLGSQVGTLLANAVITVAKLTVLGPWMLGQLLLALIAVDWVSVGSSFFTLFVAAINALNGFFVSLGQTLITELWAAILSIPWGEIGIAMKNSFINAVKGIGKAVWQSMRDEFTSLGDWWSSDTSQDNTVPGTDPMRSPTKKPFGQNESERGNIRPDIGHGGMVPDFGPLTAALAAAQQAAIDFVSSTIGVLGGWTTGVQTMLTTVSTAFTTMATPVATAQTLFVTFVANTIGVLGGWVGGITTMVTTTMGTFQSTISSGTSTGKQSFITFVGDVIGVMGGWAGGITANVGSTMGAFRSSISSGTSTGKQSFITFVADTIGVMGGWSGGIKTIVSGAMSGMVGSARSGANQMASALRDGASRAADGVRSALGRIPGIIHGIAGQGAAAAYNAGAAIGAGFANGMTAFLGQIRAAASAMVSAASAAVVAKAMISSPSKLFRKLAGFIGQAVPLGILDWLRETVQAGRAIADAAVSGFNGVMGRATLASPAGYGPGGYGALPALYAAPQHTTTTTYGTVIHAPVSISGVSDPDAAAQAAVRELQNTLVVVGGIKQARRS